MATRVPLRTMEISLDALKVAESLIGKSNPNCSSDIGVGALNLKAALMGAWLNVKINLPGIKDENLKNELFEKGKALLEEGNKIADKCYVIVEEEL